MSGATNSITMLFMSYGIWGGEPLYLLFSLLYLFLIPIAWSKWKMQKSFKNGHTIPQLISGFLLGFLGTIGIIILFQMLGFPIAWFV